MPDHAEQQPILKTPWNWQRKSKPDSQLTTPAALSLLTEGRLQQRDLDTLRAVWMYGALSTNQIRRLVFHTLKESSAAVVASRRLSYLYQEHCLNRDFRGIGKDFVYTLDVLGVQIIQMEQRRRVGDKVDLIRNIGEKPLRLEHSLAVAEFGVSLTEAARLHPAGGGLRWRGQDVIMLTRAGDRRFTPDGMGILRLGKNKTPFFLEWDSDDSLLPAIDDKIAGYIAYLRDAGAWRSQFARFPAVLLVTPHVEESLVKAEGVLRSLRDNEDLTVLVTAPETLLTQQGVLSCVWRKAGAAGAGRAEMSLLQLAGVSTQ